MRTQTIAEIIDGLEKVYPKHLAEDWDNVGLLVGNINASVTGIMVALDVTDDVITEALEHNCNLIVTHHPIIFKGIKDITAGNRQGELLLRLCANQIAVYTIHTNADNTFENGTGYALKQQIRKYLEIESLLGCGYIASKGDQKSGYAVIIRPTPLRKVANAFKFALNLTNVTVVGDLDKVINSIAICTGTGMSHVQDAIAMKADVFVTGDIGYHAAMDTDKIALIDVTHYASERPIVDIFADILSGLTKFDDIVVRATKSKGQPFQII